MAHARDPPTYRSRCACRAIPETCPPGEGVSFFLRPLRGRPACLARLPRGTGLSRTPALGSRDRDRGRISGPAGAALRRERSRSGRLSFAGRAAVSCFSRSRRASLAGARCIFRPGSCSCSSRERWSRVSGTWCFPPSRASYGIAPTPTRTCERLWTRSASAG